MLCQEALNDARGWAMRRKVAPECYGADGKLREGMLFDVIDRMTAAGFDYNTGLQLARQAPDPKETP